MRAAAAEIDDEALAAAWYAGDEAAFSHLYAQYAPRVTAYAHRLLGRREDAEDVCIETFVRIVEGRWRPEGSVRAWLFTVAHRCCLERLRRRRLKDRVFGLFRVLPAGPARDPESDVLCDERGRRLAAALAALSEDHRAVVLLCGVQELSAREAGEVLGLTDQQVRSQLSYARRLLRETTEEGR